MSLRGSITSGTMLPIATIPNIPIAFPYSHPESMTDIAAERIRGAASQPGGQVNSCSSALLRDKYEVLVVFA